MKRTVLFALMIPLLLAGCGQGADEEAAIQDWRQNCERSEIRFSADILTQTRDSAFSCSADCLWEADTATVTLTAPETVAGVRYRAETGQRALVYEGAELLFAPPESEQIPPAEAIPLLLEAIARGRLARFWQEDGCRVLELETEEDITVSIWLREWEPIRAQLRQDGYTGAELTLRQWQQKEA